MKHILAAGGVMLAAQAGAATPEQLGLSTSQINALLRFANAPAVSPGIALGSPVGFGLSWGQVATSVGGTTLPEGSGQDYDGSAALGFGIGDAQDTIALETYVNIISLRESFGDDGNVNLKLHTALPYRSAFAVGVENVARWGAAKQTESSVYAVGTKFIDLAPDAANPIPMSINLGIGDNRFEDSADDTANIFGGVAVFPHEQVSLIADWTGVALNVGVSAVPFRKAPFTVTLGLSNVTERFNADSEFIGAVGYSFTF